MAREPFAWLLVQSLQTALRAIAVDAGYHHDLASASVKLDPDHATEDFERADAASRPVVFLEPLRPVIEYRPSMQARIEWPVTVHWFGSADATDDDSRLLGFTRACADVERAITQDVSRGGLAVDTRIVGMELDRDVRGTELWATVDVVMVTHRTYGEPDGDTA